MNVEIVESLESATEGVVSAMIKVGAIIFFINIGYLGIGAALLFFVIINLFCRIFLTKQQGGKK